MPAQIVARTPRIFPSFRGGEFHFLLVIAAVRRRLVVLAARLGPLDRPVQLPGAEHGNEFSGIGRNLASKPSTHLRSDHAQFVLRHTGHD